MRYVALALAITGAAVWTLTAAILGRAAWLTIRRRNKQGGTR